MEALDEVEPVVIIIGAGLTGLLAAQGLKQNGFRPIVFEKDTGLDARPREWTMLMHWAMPIFQRLVPKDILRDLHLAICNPYLDFDSTVETLPCYNGVTGNILFSSPTPGARRVSRRRLRALLAQDIDIRWSMKLKAITETEDGVQAEFEGGQKIKCGYILGADGTHSRVRELLLGAEKSKCQGSGFLFATGITKYGDVSKVAAVVDKHPVAAIMMGTGSVGGVGVLSVDDPCDESTWTTFWVKIWRGASVNLRGQEALEYIHDKTVPLRDIFQAAIEWTPDDSYVSVNEMKTWVPVAWDNYGGRVTLAGDAAHPMLLYRGQGLQNAITDVDNYITALGQLRANAGSRQEVMTAYDDEVVERGSEAVKQSLSEADKSLDIETVKQMLMMTKGHGK